MSFFIDWYLSALFMSVAVIIFESINNKTLTMNVELSKLPIPYAICALILEFVFTVLYFNLPQLINKEKYNGQTVGKKIMHIKVKKADSSSISFLDNLLRYGVGFILVEQTFNNCSFSIRTFIDMILPTMEIGKILLYIGCAISLISVFLLFKDKNHQMLHDKISKTIVTTDE